MHISTAQCTVISECVLAVWTLFIYQLKKEVYCLLIVLYIYIKERNNRYRGYFLILSMTYHESRCIISVSV